MFDEVRENYSLIRILIILLIIAVGSYVLGLAWGVLGKFVDLLIILLVAWLLSFILEPVVGLIRKLLKLSKLISTIITYILISALLATTGFVYIPLISSQILALTNAIPKYLEFAPPIMVGWSTVVTSQLGNSVTLIPSVAQFLFSALLVLILSFYFIIDKEKINR